jgi:hypothetical protein
LLETVLFLLKLEARGFTIRRDGDALVVSPGRWLSPTDRATIYRHRGALLAVVDHVTGAVQ